MSFIRYISKAYPTTYSSFVCSSVFVLLLTGWRFYQDDESGFSDQTSTFFLYLSSFLYPNHIWSALQQYWEVTSDSLICIWGKNCNISLCWHHTSDMFPQWIKSTVIQNSRKVNKIMNNSIKWEYEISLFHLMLFDWYCMWSLVWWKKQMRLLYNKNNYWFVELIFFF